MPINEWTSSDKLTGAEQLDAILAQSGRVSNPAFNVFSRKEFEEIMLAKPFMTDAESRKIARSIHTDGFIGAVAEAVGRIRVQGLVNFN